MALNLLDVKAVEARKFLYGEIFLHNAVETHDPAKNLTYRWGIQDGWKLILPHKENVATRAGKGSQAELARSNSIIWPRIPLRQKTLAKVNGEESGSVTAKVD